MPRGPLNQQGEVPRQGCPQEGLEEWRRAGNCSESKESDKDNAVSKAARQLSQDAEEALNASQHPRVQQHQQDVQVPALTWQQKLLQASGSSKGRAKFRSSPMRSRKDGMLSRPAAQPAWYISTSSAPRAHSRESSSSPAPNLTWQQKQLLRRSPDEMCGHCPEDRHSSRQQKQHPKSCTRTTQDVYVVPHLPYKYPSGALSVAPFRLGFIEKAASYEPGPQAHRTKRMSPQDADQACQVESYAAPKCFDAPLAQALPQPSFNRH
ncbi:hypothetical protein K437DRAFT_35448 [Tilletiaria anomala UBC 951]|uniref:Uncharacterized protein n=1 Tax=Tilletiaria anomala (strain ATCC 24038 / CBS 436.72 / UBC 951) TaxID=1037660 RepID=A0A066VGE0_TILAU|nr:uncharacterized protein K437DRAFT_35448 [Tilletiaria anomala UBC 951]KDN37819.1 hypothetical protein K437DRAFT_35448 [Tilletiaria anomala UBC 951]